MLQLQSGNLEGDKRMPLATSNAERQISGQDQGQAAARSQKD